MIRNDCARPVEPERGDLGEDLALVGDARAEHVVEGGNAIGRDDQQAIAEIVDIANLSLSIGSARGERGVENGGGERQVIPRPKRLESYRDVSGADNNNM